MRISDLSSDVCSSDLTLIYDLSTGQWAWWTTGDRNSWRANVGLNWRSAGSIPDIYGSNIIIGDDNYGILWVLDPSQGTDDDLIDDTDHTFPRVATGQLTTTGRNYQPIYKSEENTSELQSLMRNSYAVFCLKKKKTKNTN